MSEDVLQLAGQRQLEQTFINLLVEGIRPKKAMAKSGLYLDTKSSTYQRLYKSAARARKKKLRESEADIKKTAEAQALNLMLEGRTPSDALQIAGLNYLTHSKEYNRLLSKLGRLRQAENNRQVALQRAREVAILKSKYDSLQRHRHDANRAKIDAQTAYADIRQLKKQND